jgi:hypothetical protein
MIAFRHAPSRYPFFWESMDQPSARWHRQNEGPAQYLADTPTGAWAEFLRHEGITEEIDLRGVTRAIWAVQISDTDFAIPELSEDITCGGEWSYDDCQEEAARLRSQGATALRAPSAALHQGGARGWRVESGLRAGPDTDGHVIVLFGTRPQTIGWLVTDRGRPPAETLLLVRHL